MKRRFKAQCGKYGIILRLLGFHVVSATIDMMTPNCTTDFLDTIEAVEKSSGEQVIMIVVDTTAKAIAAGGGEENAAKDKNILRANARRVLDVLPRLHIMLVSHTGKDVEKGERGSNAGLGDDDMFVMLNGCSAYIQKRNDGPEDS